MSKNTVITAEFPWRRHRQPHPSYMHAYVGDFLVRLSYEELTFFFFKLCLIQLIAPTCLFPNNDTNINTRKKKKTDFHYFFRARLVMQLESQCFLKLSFTWRVRCILAHLFDNESNLRRLWAVLTACAPNNVIGRVRACLRAGLLLILIRF